MRRGDAKAGSLDHCSLHAGYDVGHRGGVVDAEVADVAGCRLQRRSERGLRPVGIDIHHGGTDVS
jgi:hypothetical protein